MTLQKAIELIQTYDPSLPAGIVEALLYQSISRFCDETRVLRGSVTVTTSGEKSIAIPQILSAVTDVEYVNEEGYLFIPPHVGFDIEDAKIVFYNGFRTAVQALPATVKAVRISGVLIPQPFESMQSDLRVPTQFEDGVLAPLIENIASRKGNPILMNLQGKIHREAKKAAIKYGNTKRNSTTMAA